MAAGRFGTGVTLFLAAVTAHFLLPDGAVAQVTDPLCPPVGIGPSVLPAVIENVSPRAPVVAGESLPRTGSSLLVPVAIGVLLLCIGALLVVMARRRRSASALVVVVALLGLLAGLASGVIEPVSAQTDPCAAMVPPPVIPESPQAILLPLSAAALVAGVVLVMRRRDRDAFTPA